LICLLRASALGLQAFNLPPWTIGFDALLAGKWKHFYFLIPAEISLHRTFFPAFQAVAKSWSNVPEAVRHDHFFGTVDFEKSPEIFRKVADIRPIPFASFWFPI
jgi:hypothetical protein